MGNIIRQDFDFGEYATTIKGLKKALRLDMGDSLQQYDEPPRNAAANDAKLLLLRHYKITE